MDYFVGLSGRAYGQFCVSAGLHLGQVSRLPNGLTAVDEVRDANALANLPKQTKGALFLALSYAFVNPGQDVYTRPFKNADPKEVRP